MFVYSGKLKWLSYGVDETFVVVLPSGPVRVGDVAYSFTQWTVDSKGVKKPNWFQNLVVDKVTKTATGDDTFAFKSHYYSFEATSKGGYAKLDLTMSKPGVKSLMTLDRIWQSDGAESTQPGRIWTGKINWLSYASDELAIFIAPEGLGEGKPILSLWQWTQDSAGNKKSPSFRQAVQKVDSSAPAGQVKFSYHSYYDVACTWDEKTEKLAVKMTENGTTKDIGEMTLAAIIDRHSHDFNPIEAAPSKAELEVRLPQPQDNLPRILTPMPFPKGLFDTLVHAASFIDQAGYLAKHAQERFIALDADLHTRDNQLKAAKTENGLATETVKKLQGDIAVEKVKNEEAVKQLAQARDDAEKEKNARIKKIEELQDLLQKGANHDASDHKILEATRKDLVAAQARVAELTKLLDAANAKVTALDALLKTEVAASSVLRNEKLGLEAALRVEKVSGEKLAREKTALKAENTNLNTKLGNLQTDLAAAKDKNKEQADIIADLQNKLANVTTERDDFVKKAETEKAAAKLRKERLEELQRQEDEIHKLRRQALGEDA
ncbi:hypothetical protein B0J13DRAFT_607620 [Dactylonectria estremocensis]|uniref:Uncharacterized protein n=1 Tax=Dactylonectria estremocensis TaxID=1079267 RepID=A0A9P9ETB9_9HYPO|nr:hypothetical protein B0J13DRAFT_607620 [Dactylonectria estremocensis]